MIARPVEAGSVHPNPPFAAQLVSPVVHGRGRWSRRRRRKCWTTEDGHDSGDAEGSFNRRAPAGRMIDRRRRRGQPDRSRRRSRPAPQRAAPGRAGARDAFRALPRSSPRSRRFGIGRTRSPVCSTRRPPSPVMVGTIRLADKASSWRVSAGVPAGSASHQVVLADSVEGRVRHPNKSVRDLASTPHAVVRSSRRFAQPENSQIAQVGLAPRTPRVRFPPSSSGALGSSMVGAINKMRIRQGLTRLSAFRAGAGQALAGPPKPKPHLYHLLLDSAVPAWPCFQCEEWWRPRHCRREVVE